MKTTARFFLLGLTGGFFFFFPYYSVLTNDWNRLEIIWGRSDPFIIVLIILASGLIWACLAWLVYRYGPRGLSRDRLFVLGVFLSMWPALDFFISYEILKVGLLIGLGALIFRVPAKTKEMGQLLLNIASPVVVVFVIQIFTFPTIATQSGKMLESNAKNESHQSRIIFFLFDEWSYDHTFQSGQPNRDLKFLNEFVRSCSVYHNAYSPGTTTNVSVPRILGTATSSTPYRPTDTVFDVAFQQGWSNYILGCYLPYAYWFSGVTQYSQQVPAYKSADMKLTHNINVHFQMALYSALVRWNPELANAMIAPYQLKVQAQRIEYMMERTKIILNSMGEKSFGYFHFSLPHDPFISVDQAHGKNATYADNIVLVDRSLEEIVSLLKEKNLWDNSYIVVTSDHAWKTDPRYEDISSSEELHIKKRHVPLFIKEPGQKIRKDVREITLTENLKTILEPILKNEKVL